MAKAIDLFDSTNAAGDTLGASPVGFDWLHSGSWDTLVYSKNGAIDQEIDRDCFLGFLVFLVSLCFWFPCVPPPHRMIGARRFEMLFEQITAAVTRTLVVANVREICRVVSFVDASRLHLWQMRMLGMPCYLLALFSGDLLPSSQTDDSDHRMRRFRHGSKRGNQPGQPMLAPANCQWIAARA